MHATGDCELHPDDERDILTRFSVRNVLPYHADKLLRLRNRARSFAREIYREVPPSRERATSLKRLEEAYLMAEQGVLRRVNRPPLSANVYAPPEPTAADHMAGTAVVNPHP